MMSTNSRTGITFTGPTFWISNRTARVLAVTPWAVELKEAANWTKCDYRDLTGPICLGPSAAGTQTIDFSSQLFPPPTNTWRLEINVAEKLSRPEALLAVLQHYPNWLPWRRSVNTNLYRMTFRNHLQATWYGHARKVLSENVGESTVVQIDRP